MLSIPDMALLGAAALLLFGPDQLPRVARKAGGIMREIQNTSQSFIREMERAAEIQDAAEAKPYTPPPHEPLPFDDAPTVAFPAIDPPAPEPDFVADHELPPTVAEKLAEPSPAKNASAEPSPALDLIYGRPAPQAEP